MLVQFTVSAFILIKIDALIPQGKLFPSCYSCSVEEEESTELSDVSKLKDTVQQILVLTRFNTLFYIFNSSSGLKQICSGSYLKVT